MATLKSGQALAAFLKEWASAITALVVCIAGLLAVGGIIQDLKAKEEANSKAVAELQAELKRIKTAPPQVIEECIRLSRAQDKMSSLDFSVRDGMIQLGCDNLSK